MRLADRPPQAHGAALLAADARRAILRRVLAVVVDVLVLSLLTFFINGVFGVTRVTSGSLIPPSTMFTSYTDVGWGWLTLIWLVYFTGLEALFGATVGKWALDLRVTDREGRRPSLRQIVVRNVVRVVDALPAGYVIGGVVALLSPARQRLGDHLAHTVVLPREALAMPLLRPEALRWRLALVGVVVLASLAFSGAFYYYGRPPLVVQSMANTRQMVFGDGVSSYTLSAPAWGAGTVTYEIVYRTQHSAGTCHARLTLDWTLPTGWQPRSAESFCAASAPLTTGAP